MEMSRVRQLWQHGGVGDELMREELRGKENRRDEENEIAEASRAAQLLTLLDCIDGSQLATLAVQLHLSAFQPLPSALGFRTSVYVCIRGLPNLLRFFFPFS